MNFAISDYFRKVLLQASSIPPTIFHSSARPPPKAHDRLESKILQGVLFSRRFIITYNLALVAILLCCSLWYWGSKTWHARRGRKSVMGDSGGGGGIISKDDANTHPVAESSSSSSSTGGDEFATPPLRAKERGHKDENTPLLPHKEAPSSTRFVCIVRSWMMYQPSNIPFVNKTLPSNATSVAILLFLGLNVFYLLYRLPLAVPTAFVCADRAGLVFVANLPLLYLFAAKNQPIKWLTGYSYESLNIIHRRLGEWMCLVAVLHLAGMLVTWYTLLSATISFGRFLSIPVIWLGATTFVAYQMLYLTSLGSFRQRFYELFLGLHVVLQAIALGFLFFHHQGAKPYVGIALGIFLIDRVVFRIGLKTRAVKADLSIMEDGDTVMLSSDWPVSHMSWWPHIKNGWKPTEHVFLTVTALSRKHIIQAHPFTIASDAPNTHQGDGTHAWLNFIIRSRDGFSRDLLRYAQSHRSASVRVDGPYGSLHALEMLRDSQHSMVVAGGSGIAVAYPLLWDLLSGDQGGRRVTLIWVIHDEAHIEWIGQHRLDELRERGLHVIIPPPTRKTGRPAMGELIKKAVAQGSQDKSSSVGVVVSGPDSMNRSARNTCAELVRQGLDVSVSVEKFGW